MRMNHVVHKFSFNDKNFVLDVNSGCIHLLDQVSYDVLDFYKPDCSFDKNLEFCRSICEKYDEGTVREVISEIDYLVSSSKLFSKLEIPNVESFSAPIKSMCLNIAHDCQLRCKYCFASHGDFGGKRSLMDYDTAKNSIDFLVQNSGHRRNLEVDFFGGEPLMNFKVVRDIVGYARKIEKKFDKNFRFTITTNGILLDDEKIDFINSEMNNVVLSLDGRKFVNDDMRVFKSGKGCYDLVVEKFQKLVRKRGKKAYFVRGTFTSKNLDFSKDVMHLFNLGFKKISIEPAVLDENIEFSLERCKVLKILKEYEKLSDLVLSLKRIDKNFSFFHFEQDFKKGPCMTKRIKGCGCGNEYVSVTPEGDIYPCHQFVGDVEFKMGNVNSGEFDVNIKKFFSIPNLISSDECKNCWAKFFCGGGCSANNWNFNKKINKPHKLSCNLMKKRIEMSVVISSNL